MSRNHGAWTLGEEVYRIGSWREYLASVGTVKPMEISPLDPGRTALMIVDVQRKMADRSVAGRVVPADPRLAEREKIRGDRIDNMVLPNIKKLLSFFRAHKLAVLHFAAGPQLPRAEDLPLTYRLLLTPGIKARGSTVHWSSPEFEFMPELLPLDNEFVIRKRTRSGFIHSDAARLLNSIGITDLVFVGGATEACVESSARDAADCNFQVVVVEDAVIPTTALNQDATMISIACFFGGVRTTEEVLAELGGATRGEDKAALASR
jgi:nicotinamidase-related amidase